MEKNVGEEKNVCETANAPFSLVIKLLADWLTSAILSSPATDTQCLHGIQIRTFKTNKKT